MKAFPEWLIALVRMLRQWLPPFGCAVVILPHRGLWAIRMRGVRFLVPTLKDTIVTHLIYCKQSYERYLKVERGDIVVDAGACIGGFTLIASNRAADKGLVVAIEPEPANSSTLRRNTSGLSNVRTVEKCVWKSRGKMRLNLAEEGIDGHSLLPSPRGKWVEVEADTIDNIVSKLGIERVDFLKMDVEGAEMEALEGAEWVLKRVKKIVIAGYHKLGYGRSCYGVRQFLEKRGFKTKIDYEGLVHAWRNDSSGLHTGRSLQPR